MAVPRIADKTHARSDALLPGVYVSGLILVRGVREDYANHVEGFLLQPGYPGRLLFPGNFVT
jgi:hypothetical protein